ncbi:MAG: TGS domain-containing protein [bacterium]|nr:TGS domain-containing protein [bacterium]MCP4963617.1 TGS domain-containing protein [bacterium]
MPANVTPAYKAAEAAFRKARDPDERLDGLREMYRTIPKHKGTEHIRADIKTRMKELTEQLSGPQKGGARSGPATVIRPDGAAQIAIVGPPNSGKSALHARLTGSHSPSEPYPFATQFPQPGMMPVDDIHLQLIDLPSISPEHPIPWIGNALQPADCCLLVVDLAHPGTMDRVTALHENLSERRVHLVDKWPKQGEPTIPEFDPFAVYLPTILVVNKIDLEPGYRDDVEVFEELTGYTYPYIGVSATTGAGLDELGHWLTDQLEVVRVYTKIPGQPPDMTRPFTVRHGETVHDVARLVHKDVARGLKYARVWGKASFDGQQVGPDHEVVDGDVLELHA